MSVAPKVLIVGGGPSGLVLAISLLQNGIPIRIIEKNAKPRFGQRGAGIMPRTLELFSTFRIIDRVMKHAIPIPRVRKYQLPGGTQIIQEFDMLPPQDPTPSYPYLNPVMLGQDRLEKIFHTALAELGSTVEFGTVLTSFTQFGDRVEAKLKVNGTDPDNEGVEEISSFEYIVGADGAKGVIWKQLGLTCLGETRQIENFVVGDIRVEGLPQQYWHMWGDPTSIMVSLRGTEEPTLFNFVIMGKDIDHACLTSDYDALRKILTENTGNRPDIKFGEAPCVSNYTPNIRMVDKFGIGRVFVAGDSAHIYSPIGGQGMNTGIQDSHNLGWKLALVIKRLSPPILLDTYTEERLPVVAEMLNQTIEILEATFNGSEDKPWDRDSSLLQLGVNYRWSSIVLDERQDIETRQEIEDDEFMASYAFEWQAEDIDSYFNVPDDRLRAGDRAPDAPGLVDRSPSALFHTTYNLFRIFGSYYHTVLIFAELVEPRLVLKLLAVYPPGTVRSIIITRRGRTVPDSVAASADMVLEDWHNHAYEAYVPTNACGIIIIRPDGFIGGIVDDRRWLHDYFLGLFAGDTKKHSSSASTSPYRS